MKENFLKFYSACKSLKRKLYYKHCNLITEKKPLMKLKKAILLGLLFFCCHKDPMTGQDFFEIKKFEWSVEENFNQLNIKIWLLDCPVENVAMTQVKIKVENIYLQNSFDNPMVIIDNDEGSVRKGEKCIKVNWSPTLTISPQNIEEIRIYIK